MASNGKTIVPPQNLEAEESVLGAMMVSESTIEPVLLDVRLHAEDFYRDRHRTIYQAIIRLNENADPVDVLTVSEALAQRGQLDEVGGRDVVASLAAKVPAPGSAKHYALIVKQNSLMRRLDGAAKRIQQSIVERDGEPSELVEQAERLLFQVAHEERAVDFREIGEILHEEIDKLEALSKGTAEVTGTPSGFRDLDDKTAGFQPGNLIIIAARPSMGKSSLICNFAENIALKEKKPVALFSLEMSEMELAHRFIGSQSRISSDRLRKGKVGSKDWPKVVKACNLLEEAPLWIDDSSDLGLLELRAKARRLHAQERGRGHEGLGIVIVDYIQLMRNDDQRAGRVEQVGQFSRGLKILARELSVPVIGVSQLSRAPEQRPDKRPILSDLRESGCLAADSRVYLPDQGHQVPIAKLEGRSGFKVLALNPDTLRLEARTVERAFSTGRRRVFRLTTNLGRTIRATGNHKFMTIDGWRRLDELEVGDQISVPRQLPGPRGDDMSPDELANTNRDVIPRSVWRSIVEPARVEPGLTTRALQADLGISYCGSTLYKSGISRARASKVAVIVGSPDSMKLSVSDVYWDQIGAVEEQGTENVYDLTVEGLHNFVAENIVVHNSIEQDADVVGFLYRDDYYNQDSEDPGGAELNLAKHRNGPVGTVRLVFLEHYPKFADRAREERPVEQPAGEGPPIEDLADAEEL